MLYFVIELVAKAIILNIKVFMAHSNSSLENLPSLICASAVKVVRVYFKKESARQTGIKLTKYPALEFLLISFVTDKEMFARCLSISWTR